MKKENILNVVLMVVIGVLVVVGTVQAATTISTNIVTEGTLSVTGTTTLATGEGNMEIGNNPVKTSPVLTVNGYIKQNAGQYGGFKQVVISARDIDYTNTPVFGGGVFINALTTASSSINDQSSVIIDGSSYGGPNSYTNIIIGQSAATLGDLNGSVIIGYLAKHRAFNGAGVAVGQSAITDAFSVALGASALSSGLNDIAIGRSASVTGTSSIAIGFGAGTSGFFTNATAIGLNAIAGASNTFILGGTGSSAVSVGIGTTTPTTQLQVTASASNATSTITIGKVGQNKGSCLELFDAVGTAYYLSVVGGAVQVTTVSCK